MPRNTAALVGDHPLFAELSEEMAAMVRGCARNITVKAGEYLLLEGDAADVFYLIRRGQVTLETRAPWSPATCYRDLGTGDRDRLVLAVPAISLAVRCPGDRASRGHRR